MDEKEGGRTRLARGVESEHEDAHLLVAEELACAVGRAMRPSRDEREGRGVVDREGAARRGRHGGRPARARRRCLRWRGGWRKQQVSSSAVRVRSGTLSDEAEEERGRTERLGQAGSPVR